jgi:hypothetical protein
MINEEKMKALVDDQFLTNLVELGRLYGWSGDYYEVAEFIMKLHEINGTEITHEEMEPYD